MSDLAFSKVSPGSNVLNCETDISICSIIEGELEFRVAMYNIPQTIVGKLKIKNVNSIEVQDKVKYIFQLFNKCLLDDNDSSNIHWIDILKEVKILELSDVHAALLNGVGGVDSYIYTNSGENIIFWLDSSIEEKIRLNFILNFCIKYNELLGVKNIQENLNG